MPTHPSIGIHAVPCPKCGYDLRAARRTSKGVRCPECGTLTPVSGKHGLTTSRLPWVQRGWRGRMRAFFLTLWIVLARPALLSRELEVPARMADARRFRLVCLLLAMLPATAWLMLAMVEFNTEGWWVLPGVRFPTIIPASLLLDRWYGLFPLAAGVFVANWACLELYRWIVCLGGGPPPPKPLGEPHYMRRRMAALSQYGAGLILMQALLLGWLWNVWLTMEHVGRKSSSDLLFLQLLALALAALAAGSHLLASLGLVLRTGRWRGLRLAMMLVYPVAAYAVWIVVLTALNWVVGYVVLGVRSMLA